MTHPALRTRLVLGFPALVALGLYVASLGAGPSDWDTAEFQAVPYFGGILHPPGFPAYTVVGWLFSHLVPIGRVAFRMNLLSALCGVAAVFLLALTAYRLGAAPLIAAGTAAIFFSSETIWHHVTQASTEALLLLVVVGAFALLLVPGEPALAHVAGAAFLAGLALATHTVAIWFMPGIAILLVRAAWRFPRAKVALLIAVAFGVGLLPYAYLPLRSAYVTVHGLDPVAVHVHLIGKPFVDYDHPADLAGFLRLVTGADFGNAASSATLHALINVAAYPTYIGEFATSIVVVYGNLGLLLAALGIAALWSRRSVALALIVGAFGVFPFSLSYGVLVDAAKYYLVSTWLVGLLVAAGATALQTALSSRGRLVSALVPATLGFFAVGAIVGNAGNIAVGRSFDGDHIIASAQHTPQDGYLVAGWAYVTPLAYARYVEHSLGDVVLMTNIPYDDFLGIARKHTLYYMPFPEYDVKIKGVNLIHVPDTTPPLYVVFPLPG